jgi:hypothetical protein
MQTKFARWNTRLQRGVLVALVVAGLAAAGAVATAPVTAAPPADPASAENTLLGHVLLPAGTASAGAGIAAEQDGSQAPEHRPA